MKIKIRLISFLAAFPIAMTSVPVVAQELTGDTRLACEATLCLASGTRPNECMPSLQKYFSISFRKVSDTLRGRVNFLKLCPAGNQTPQMESFVDALANGAGRCDADTLNRTNRRRWGENNEIIVSNQLPNYCSAYMGNPYSNLGGIRPNYVGTPERGGYWTPASEYDAALINYNHRIAEEDAERRRNSREYR